MTGAREPQIQAFGWMLMGAVLLGMSAPIEIVRPSEGEALTFMPVDIEVEFDDTADTLTFQVLLNGNDISSDFTLSAPFGGRITASADDVWSGFVLLGGNAIAASIEIASVPQNAARAFTTSGDPYADAVPLYVQGANGGFNAGSLPGVVTGSPVGGGLFIGGTDVVSLGRDGEIQLSFDDNVIVDGPGVDFTVFENAFLEIGAGSITDPPFAEPARVSVSQDGSTWIPFSCSLILAGGPYWPGCAGIYPVLSDGTLVQPHASIPTSVPIQDLVGVSIFTITAPPGSGGDSFDLADVGLSWARYVRIQSADFDVDVVGSGNSGFDLDAVAAVHSSPTVPSVPSLQGIALVLLVALLGSAGAARAGDLPAVSARSSEDARVPKPSLAQRLARIREQVQRARSYPPIARKRGIEGETQVAFEIGFDGVPFDIATESSSGSGALDRAARQAVERAGTLPWVYGRVTVPVHFQLRDPD
jgi:TonB family protein